MSDDRLIIALDVPTRGEAEALVDRIGDAGAFYKIGYQLLPLGGYELATALSAKGKKVFIDAKFLDIGATVERGVRSVASVGADFLTVHADPDTVKGAAAGKGDDPRLKILAVTVLTSWGEDNLAAHRLPGPVDDLVLFRAEMALENGADGVVASAKEAAAIRARFGDALTIVTPGVRPPGASADDQKRVVTPADAFAAGADHIVVGRPITKAEDPAEAVRQLLAGL